MIGGVRGDRQAFEGDRAVPGPLHVHDHVPGDAGHKGGELGGVGELIAGKRRDRARQRLLHGLFGGIRRAERAHRHQLEPGSEALQRFDGCGGCGFHCDDLECHALPLSTTMDRGWNGRPSRRRTCAAVQWRASRADVTGRFRRCPRAGANILC